MLDGLEEVDWLNLQTAYGTAEQVPGWIRALASPHPADWSEAMFALEGTILHQGSVYSATVAAIPFLLELLASPNTHCRGHILSFLSGTFGGFYTSLAQEETRSDTHYRAAEEDEELQQYLEAERICRRQCGEAVWKGWEVYLSLLQEKTSIRLQVPHLLGMLAYRAADLIPLSLSERDPLHVSFQSMQQRVEVETHILVRASLIFGLARFSPRFSAATSILQEHLLPAYSPQERLSAAWNLVQQGTSLPEETVLFLADTLQNHAWSDHLFEADFPGIEWRYHPIKRALMGAGIHEERMEELSYDPSDLDADEDINFPWEIGWPRFNTIACLCRLDAEPQPQVQSVLLTVLATESPYTANLISGPILRYLFQCDRLPAEITVADFTPVQREALRILYDNPMLWTTACSNNDEVFDAFGLPLERSRWSELLEMNEADMNVEEALHLLEALVREDASLPADAPLSAKDRQAVRWLTVRTLCSDSLMPLLGRLPNLESLDISSSKVTDRGLKMLPSLLKLTKLHLTGTPVTNEGLQYLTRLPNLSELNLSGTKVTGTGLNTLARLPKLRSLWLYNTDVSKFALTKFRVNHPRCEISK